MSRFLDALRDRPLVLDAAMGTRLIARGLDLAADDPCLWALDRPEDVLDLHRRDLDAGADAVLADTFGANRRWLARFGREDDWAAVNRAAVALARRAAGPDRFVIGSIGPYDAGAEDERLVREQAVALAESGADALILETHGETLARTRVPNVRKAVDLPILVSLCDSGWVGDLAGVAAVGCNCLAGMGRAEQALGAYVGRSSPPLLAMPSAGLPGEEPESPEAFAAGVPRLLALGVRLIGGCCGTTEAHVAAIRGAVDRAASEDKAQITG